PAIGRRHHPLGRSDQAWHQRSVQRADLSTDVKWAIALTSSLRGAQATKQSSSGLLRFWIASRSLSSGAHSRDPFARNDGILTPFPAPPLNPRSGRRRVRDRL